MATLEDLDFESITDLSDADLHELLRKRRLERRTPKQTKKKKPVKRKEKKAEQVSATALSPEQAKAVLDELKKLLGDSADGDS